MSALRITNLTRGTCLADRATLAHTFFRRLRGLLGQADLPPGQGLLLQPCQSVHTFGMQFSLDLVFLDRDGVVRATIAALPPGRTAPPCHAAWQVLELPVGTLARTGTIPGDQLSIVPA